MAYTWIRYLLPVVPLTFILIASGFWNIVPPKIDFSDLVTKFKFQISFRGPLIGICLLISCLQTFSSVHNFFSNYYEMEYRRAGEWLNNFVAPDSWLMVPDTHVAWYAGTDKFVHYPRDHSVLPAEAVLHRKQDLFFFTQEGFSTEIHTDIDYFIYDKRVFSKVYPSLMTNSGPVLPDNFKKLFELIGSKTHVSIYEIQKKPVPGNVRSQNLSHLRKRKPKFERHPKVYFIY
jgi:hypothetical protein